MNPTSTKAVILTLDKRIKLAEELLSSIIDLGSDCELFIAGDGKTLGNDYHYSHIDVNELPPVYTHSTTYPTWWSRPNAYNAWLCHKKIMEQAIAENKHLWLLEDDAFIEEDFAEIMKKVEPFFETNNWNMLYLGGYHRQGSWFPTMCENIIKVNGSGGWHGVIIKKHIMEMLVKIEPLGPFDWISSLVIHPMCNCYAIYPSVISQRDAQFSYVENTVLNKPSRYER